MIESAHFLASIDGIVLLFVVPGLFRRLDGAWWMAVVLVLMNLAFALAKGLAYGEAGVAGRPLTVRLNRPPSVETCRPGDLSD